MMRSLIWNSTLDRGRLHPTVGLHLSMWLLDIVCDCVNLHHPNHFLSSIKINHNLTMFPSIQNDLPLY